MKITFITFKKQVHEVALHTIHPDIRRNAAVASVESEAMASDTINLGVSGIPKASMCSLDSVGN